MSFLDELRAHLRAIERGKHVPAESPQPLPSLAHMKRYFLDALERREAKEKMLTWALQEHHRRLASGWFERFVAHADRELRGGLCAGSDADEHQRHLHAIIDTSIDGGVTEYCVSEVRALEVLRVAQAAHSAADADQIHASIARYAFENRLVRGADARAAVSPLGRVLLDLPDVDAVRWLLTIETQQSTGTDDELRVHASVLAAILQEPLHSFFAMQLHEEDESQDALDAEHWPFLTAMVERLRDLGVLSQWDNEHEPAWGYDLVPAYRETLEDLVNGRRTPLSLLAESLLAEERNSVAGHAPADSSADTSFELQARHARMVVHEIRNTIVPMKMALSGLFRTLEESAPEERWRSQRERVESGVARFLRFAGDLEQIVRIGAPTMQPFDLVAAVHDAIKGLNGGLGIAVTFEPDAELPRLVGHRAHFTLVVINVLRNAAQNNPQPGAAARLTARQTAARDAVVLSIDDNGPGVPEEHREVIFRRGFALRLGGSGQGLALVREVVEREMRGAVRCESSDLGGARFILSFPLTPKEAP